MNDFVIFTDSGCDISEELLAAWGVQCEYLTFRFYDSEKEYQGNEMPSAEFFAKMRAGGIAKTAAVNNEQFAAAFSRVLDEGKDVLYIGLSSGISNTFNAGRIAAEECAEKYPDRKVIAVDSLSASSGLGLLVYLATEKKKEGSGVEEVAAFVTETRTSLSHWFTVDDLVYLKRGGRVSSTAAFVGNLLGIKPVMHVDNEGKLIPMMKVRGRKNALAELAKQYNQTAVKPATGHVYICQADCKSEAEDLARMLREQNGVEVELITDISPVIGAHAGPGTIALFFVANHR